MKMPEWLTQVYADEVLKAVEDKKKESSKKSNQVATSDPPKVRPIVKVSHLRSYADLCFYFYRRLLHLLSGSVPVLLWPLLRLSGPFLRKKGVRVVPRCLSRRQ